MLTKRLEELSALGQRHLGRFAILMIPRLGVVGGLSTSYIGYQVHIEWKTEIQIIYRLHYRRVLMML